MTRYRFKVETPDGKATVSDSFEGPAQNRARGLSTPEWSDQHFGHGENAGLKVKAAKSHEGKKIKFIVEHKNGEKWEHYQEVHGVVKNGIASAALEIRHPKVKTGEQLANIDPTSLRFHCEVI